MCYSVESSAKTSLISFIAIVVLLRSNVPHFQWLGIILIAWCGMQFDELLLWLTNPRKGCTRANKIITATLIPLVLILQPLGAVLGSLFVTPWSKCSETRKLMIASYSIFITVTLLYLFFKNRKNFCTMVTSSGHLNWWSEPHGFSSHTLYFMWGLAIVVPLFVLWDISYKLPLLITLLPLFGYNYGLTTDSNASVWCYYTSFTSIIAFAVYGLYKAKVYNILD